MADGGKGKENDQPFGWSFSFVPGSCLSAGADCERSSQGRPSFSFLTIHRMVKIASQPESDPLRRRRRLSEDRQISKTKTKQPPVGGCFVLVSGSCLSSHAVASTVLSVYEGLTSVFGMGTGGTPQLNHRNGEVSELSLSSTLITAYSNI